MIKEHLIAVADLIESGKHHFDMREWESCICGHAVILATNSRTRVDRHYLPALSRLSFRTTEAHAFSNYAETGFKYLLGYVPREGDPWGNLFSPSWSGLDPCDRAGWAACLRMMAATDMNPSHWKHIAQPVVTVEVGRRVPRGRATVMIEGTFERV